MNRPKKNQKQILLIYTNIMYHFMIIANAIYDCWRTFGPRIHPAGRARRMYLIRFPLSVLSLIIIATLMRHFMGFAASKCDSARAIWPSGPSVRRPLISHKFIISKSIKLHCRKLRHKYVHIPSLARRCCAISFLIRFAHFFSFYGRRRNAVKFEMRPSGTCVLQAECDLCAVFR